MSVRGKNPRKMLFARTHERIYPRTTAPEVPMKIVVLDGFTLNPGDLSWDELHGLGECTVHERTAPGELLERASGAQVLLTNKLNVPRDEWGTLPAGRKTILKCENMMAKFGPPEDKAPRPVLCSECGHQKGEVSQRLCRYVFYFRARLAGCHLRYQ